ncbi:MAG: hydroxyacid dehydrogenase [Actinobacteria bacterium]|nr:hydroxyacid dehydrogenase [Actinomycetota bacterium]
MTAAARPRIAFAHLAGLRFFDDADLAAFAEVGEVLDPDPIGRWDDPRAGDLLARADVLVGHWGCPPIDGAVLDRAPDLGLIAYAAGTVKGTIAPEVFDRVRVTSGAVANAAPVAEFTLAMILLANKDVLWNREVMRDPALFASRRLRATEVGNWDKTIGIVGASLVGRQLIDLLRDFPHLRVVVFDPFLSDDEAASMGVEPVDLLDLCERSDVVSIHAPDLPTTQHMIGAAELAAMKDGATLINTARGRLLDHDALLAHADRISSVLDVTHPEPLPEDHPLRACPTVFLTPHLAGSQGSELRRMAEHAVDEIVRYAAGEPARHAITRDMLDRIA